MCLPASFNVFSLCEYFKTYFNKYFKIKSRYLRGSYLQLIRHFRRINILTAIMHLFDKTLKIALSLILGKITSV